jgi:DNA helicase-2/ATP-dependent DNA helicase PcrA
MPGVCVRDTTISEAAEGRAMLNEAQLQAVHYGLPDAARPASELKPPPLLIIAGAGSGKTHTLAHRVAHLVSRGADPRRILLLTFTRRAAAEMSRRAERIAAMLARSESGGRRRTPRPISWAGTFHAVANRLLRLHAESVGLDPSFTVLVRSDAEDLIDLLRDDLGLSTKSSRFPRKSTCLAIYSHTVNAQQPLEETLKRAFPWCESWADPLRKLFSAYVEAKQKQHTLDYDDLLLYWNFLVSEPELAASVAERFDHVLVDEYQDTNALQADVLLRMCPTGTGLTVVGDDAQSIYSFRAATVRNILDFPNHFDPPAAVVKLEQNYRSTQPILAACNDVIALASERFTKQLFSERPSAQRPVLASAEDEAGQVDYIIERILEHREAGIPLRHQAVLMRTSHHSDALEVELARHNIPFLKYGGLKFLEASHVKDVLCVLRWVENPRDSVAGFRVLQLLPGIGPVSARRLLEQLAQGRFDLGSLLRGRPPAAAARDWAPLCELLRTLRAPETEWSGQLGLVRKWYGPHLERIYDAAAVRDVDLEQLEQIAGSHETREHFLSQLALDPPDAAGDEAGPPVLDEDFLSCRPSTRQRARSGTSCTC